jgi:hypothetical protein
VIGGFGWTAEGRLNPGGTTFYLDDIQYDLARPDAPRFLLSYAAPASVRFEGPVRNACYTYDNALALLSFLARGQADDLRRARIIVDAFVYAQGHDRYYTDGCLRNAYMPDPAGISRLPSWWDPQVKLEREDESHVSTSTGNRAWVILALLAYYDREGGAQYLQAAQRIGEWINSQTSDTRGAGGYTGGYVGWESSPQKIMWKSTENNIVAYAAFTRLYQATTDTGWQQRATQAKAFVTAMWNEPTWNLWTGTTNDGATINRDNIPLDI